jgi:hypothetical protein
MRHVLRFGAHVFRYETFTVVVVVVVIIAAAARGYRQAVDSLAYRIVHQSRF